MSNPWPSQRLTELLHIEHPIIQAPMAGANLAAMAIAVSEAGGLGSLPCAMLSPERLRAEVESIQAATTRPFNLNFFCHKPPAPDAAGEAQWRERLAPYYAELGIGADDQPGGPSRQPFDDAACALVELLRPPVVSFHFGLPDARLLDRVKHTGAVVLSSATTVAEARWLAMHGCDAIIAQGIDAGGHRGFFLHHDLALQLSTFALVPQIADAVSVPVIAAGGIMDSRGIVAAMLLGASGVQLGTAYLFCPEATITAAHRHALEERVAPTMITNVLTGGPARGIVTRLMREAGPLSTMAPGFPLASAAVAPLRAAAEKQGRADFSPLWAGSAYPLGRAMPARELTTTLVNESHTRLRLVAAAAASVPAAATRPALDYGGMTAVGLTARWIAASRAVESDRPDALFVDPFARDLAGTAGFGLRTAMSLGMSTGDGRDPHLAIRTRFFDDALQAAVTAWPAPQVLMLAAGMDSRGLRLDWPEGTVFFEVDRAEIFDYKEPILEQLGAVARCHRRVVRADLAHDWEAALLAAGFDRHRPSAILAEGLVMYLSEDEVRALFTTLHGLAADGSWLGLDINNAEMMTSPYTAGLIKRLDEIGCPWKFGAADPEAFLREYGWDATLTSPGDPEANFGIWPFPPMPRNMPGIPRSYFVRAQARGRRG